MDDLDEAIGDDDPPLSSVIFVSAAMAVGAGFAGYLFTPAPHFSIRALLYTVFLLALVFIFARDWAYRHMRLSRAVSEVEKDIDMGYTPKLDVITRMIYWGPHSILMFIWVAGLFFLVRHP
jgi:membrane protein YdbS with pleckstrin-like domain